MVRTVWPGKLSGSLAAIPSKSHAHRLLIAAAFADRATRIHCPAVSDDILRTAEGLAALGAQVARDPGGFTVRPGTPPERAVVHCQDSGSTWRFLLPVAAALGVETRFLLSGRLPERPMQPLYDLLEGHSAVLSGKGTQQVTLTGKLAPGIWAVPGHISSQFITGLMLAAPLTGEDCAISLTSPLASAGYVNITSQAMAAFGVGVQRTDAAIRIPAGTGYQSPGDVTVEGDWSNSAFFLCAAAACGGTLTMTGLNTASPQGDRAVLSMLRRFGAAITVNENAVTVMPAPLTGCSVDMDETPDLAPAVALLALSAAGESRLTNISRLRLKESDRARTITDTLAAIGANVRLEEDAIVVIGGAVLTGGQVDSAQDHRIAMMAACTAALSQRQVRITNWQAVSKSYPHFFDDLEIVGLNSEEEG